MINFKNDEFKQMWEFATKTSKMTSKEYDKFIKKASRQETALSTMGAYAIDLVRSAEAQGVALDMTYSTIGLLDEAVKTFFDEMTDDCYAEEAIAVILARSMASYLALLAVNEENCPCEFQDKYSQLMTQSAFDELLDVTFSGVAVKLGEEKVEFLPVALRCIRTKENDYTDLYVNAIPLVRAYEKATGIDLCSYGVVDFFLKKKPFIIE